MNRKSFEQNGPGRPKKTSHSNQPSAGLLTTVQQILLVGLLSRREVADALGLCVHSVARLTKRGHLPAIVLGRRLIRYRREDVQKFIESGVSRNGGHPQ